MSSESALMTIKAVALRTGLSVHVIRVWERRYRAIVPERSVTRRRLYTAEMVERLRLLLRLTREGRSIGTIAHLETAALIALLREGQASAEPIVQVQVTDAGLLEEALGAVRNHDASALEAVLTRAELMLGSQGMLRRMAGPLCQLLGDKWREGELTAAHEHLASAVMQSFLLRMTRSRPGEGPGPVLVTATPRGQVHELGALLVSAAAANLGWRVIYLGANLPAAELAGAVLQHQARALALSLVYPEDDTSLPGELERLRQLLPAGCALVAGGRALPVYRPVLEKLGARLCGDLSQLGQVLDELRASAIR